MPVRETVRSACEIFGLDPLYVANEGKIAVIVPMRFRNTLMDGSWQLLEGVQKGHPGKVYLETAIGGSQVIDVMVGGQLTRIC